MVEFNIFWGLSLSNGILPHQRLENVWHHAILSWIKVRLMNPNIWQPPLWTLKKVDLWGGLLYIYTYYIYILQYYNIYNIYIYIYTYSTYCTCETNVEQNGCRWYAIPVQDTCGTSVKRHMRTPCVDAMPQPLQYPCTLCGSHFMWSRMFWLNQSITWGLHWSTK